MSLSLGKVGCEEVDFRVLSILCERPAGSIQKEIAYVVGVPETTLVRIIDSLEAQGLAVRAPDPADRRVKRVQATAAAQPRLDQALEIVSRLKAEALADISPSELAICMDVLRRIARTSLTRAAAIASHDGRSPP